jgi:hypothetical protein
MVSLDPGLERVVVVVAGVEEDPNLTGHLVGCSFSTPAVEAPVDSKLEVDAVSLSQELCVCKQKPDKAVRRSMMN